MSLTHAYVGSNIIGASSGQMTANRVIAKKVTLASDGLLVSIGAYIKSNGADNVGSWNVALFSDNAGAPHQLLAYAGVTITDLFLQTAGSTTAPRWLHRPLSYWCPAGDYWISVMDRDGRIHIYYDASVGTDRYYPTGGAWFADWGFYSPTTGTDRYSIRASVIS